MAGPACLQGMQMLSTAAAANALMWKALPGAQARRLCTKYMIRRGVSGFWACDWWSELQLPGH